MDENAIKKRKTITRITGIIILILCLVIGFLLIKSNKNSLAAIILFSSSMITIDMIFTPLRFVIGQSIRRAAIRAGLGWNVYNDLMALANPLRDYKSLLCSIILLIGAIYLAKMWLIIVSIIIFIGWLARITFLYTERMNKALDKLLKAISDLESGNIEETKKQETAINLAFIYYSIIPDR